MPAIVLILFIQLMLTLNFSVDLEFIFTTYTHLIHMYIFVLDVFQLSVDKKIAEYSIQ